MKNDICLVVLNYRDSTRVSKLVETCLNYRFFDQTIVVNNPSTNDDLNNLKKILPKSSTVHLVEAKENGGYARGQNIGLRYAENFNPKPKYVAIINSDVEIGLDALISMKNLLDKYEHCAIASPKIIDKEMPNIDGCWLEPTVKETCYSFLHWKKALIRYESKRKYEEIETGVVKCFAVRGSFLFMRYDAISSVGYFDEDTFLYCEESNLAAKLKKRGFFALYDRNVSYLHNHIYKNERKKKQWVYFAKSKFAYFKKYGSHFNIFKKVILLICMAISYLLHVPLWIFKKGEK